jgi:hypothetical protein
MNTANARKRTVNARVHSFERGVRFEADMVWRPDVLAWLGAAIAINLKGLGYGG